MDQQNKRKTLRSVLQLQRRLGLAKAAGTDSMLLDGIQDDLPGMSLFLSRLHRYKSKCRGGGHEMAESMRKSHIAKR